MSNTSPKQIKILRLQYPSGFELVSLEPVKIGNWLIKASSSTYDSILVVMQNVETGEVQTGMYTNEVEANMFVVYWLQSDERRDINNE